MDLKLRPFSESFDRGSRRSPLRIAGEIEGDAFVIEVDDARVPLLTHHIEQGDDGAAAWVPSGQDFSLPVGLLRIRAQVAGDELIGAEVSVRFGPEGAASSSGFSVFFDLRGRVDGQGSERAVSEPPVLN